MSPAAEPSAATDDAAPSDRILILGGGYGGLRAAQELGRYLVGSDALEIALIDRHPYHQVITELPVAATGRQQRAHFEYPLGELLAKAHTRLIEAEVAAIDLQTRQVRTAWGTVSYGTLIIALGSVTAFYGVPGLAEHALTLKSVDDATMIREHILETLSAAATRPAGPERDALLTIVVGGGGLTGVELAGELADFVPRYAELQGLNRLDPRLVLIEGQPVLLPALPPRLQARAAEILTELGVRLILGARVTRADAEGISYGDSTPIPCRTLIWTGGIMAPSLLKESNLRTARGGSVIVDGYLRVADHPEVYAIGDSAWIVDEDTGRPVVATAQNAIAEANSVAYNIYARAQGYPERPFHDRDKGQVVSVGGRQGVASIFHVSLTGRAVLALKAVIDEGYRQEVKGHLPFDLSI